MCDHTPGPWQLLWDAKNGQAVIKGKRLDGDVNDFGFGDVVAIDVTDDNLTGKMFPPTSKESCANARVVAAAPDLLEALEHCLDVFESQADRGRYPEEFMPNNKHYLGKQGWEFLTDALAKARGTNNG